MITMQGRISLAFAYAWYGSQGALIYTFPLLLSSCDSAHPSQGWRNLDVSCCGGQGQSDTFGTGFANFGTESAIRTLKIAVLFKAFTATSAAAKAGVEALRVQ